MKVVPFVAENAAAALAQIHEQLGPDAIVLSVRPLPTQGLARLWQKSRAVEVLAGVADQSDQTNPSHPPNKPFAAGSVFRLPSTRVPPALHDDSGRPHVFIGPPGTGKTTLLCKWMALSVLNENRTAKVWRLDGTNANTAEFLNIYAEMLGLTIERFWSPQVRSPAFGRPGDAQTNDPGETNGDLLLIDLPGIQPSDTEALHALKDQLAALPNPRLHLVLNAAYETSILSQQFGAFAQFEPEDLSFCHLDEEQRQGKLLDFILGTNCSLRFLSTGQKIPGDFFLAGNPSQACAEFAG
jgi:flagellar biosynthesis GTPase FlhF